MSSVLFILEDDALIVANKGTGFSRKGVVSICNMDLSAKSVNNDRAPDDREYDESDKNLVRSILDKRIKKYDADINDLIEDVNREDGASKSYAGRFVWELLQNADDAANTEHANTHLIGTKGIGFKSVLEITDEPEIHSGNFNFHFSRQKSRVMLMRKVDKWRETTPIPVCRLPHDKEPDTVVKKLLDEGYATVIRLPLNEEKRECVRNKLSEFCSHSLLFCQSLKSVEIRANSTSRKIVVRRLKEKIELIEDDDSTYWRVWREIKKVEGAKRLSVSVCLPVRGNEIQSHEEVPPLYVFFPTTESILDVHALIHASCEVEDNREHLGSQQPHRDEICKMLKSITKAILSEIPADVALHAFGRAEKVANGEMAAQLGNAIAVAVRKTAFIPLIGGGMAKPGDVRLWEHGLGEAVDPDKVKGENLCSLKINNDEESVDILEALDAKFVSDPELAKLLCFCRNEKEADCLAAWNVAQLLMAETAEREESAVALRKAPFWPTRSGHGQVHARAIDGAVPLVARKPKNCPDWLSVDVVDKIFRKRVQEEIKRHKQENKNWENALSSGLQPLAGKSEYFNHILLPYCKQQSLEGWQENGWKILDMAFKWGGRDDKYEPLIINSGDDKEKRAKDFHLPVGKSAHEWVPAWQCYGGAAWGGPKIFDKYFADIPDRYVLSPAGDWNIDITGADKEQWKNLLSWIGCSWILKVEQSNSPHSQRDYVHNTYWIFEFYFEHFDEIFSGTRRGKLSDYAPLLSMAPEMHKIACEKEARYFYYNENLCDSYALKQLQQKEWVPCKRSLLYPDKYLFKPKDAYLPRCGLDGLLPEVDKHDLDESAWSAVEMTLKKLEAKDSVSRDAKQLVEYMNRLSKCTYKSEQDRKWVEGGYKGKIARAANEIFSAYVKIQPTHSLDDNVMVPCLRHTPKGEMIYFEKAEKTCWANESYFYKQPVRKTILMSDNLHIFFRFLKDGENFDLDKLSEFLDMEPVYGVELQGKTKHLRQRYEERIVGLEKVAKQKPLEKLEIVAYDTISLKANAHAEITPEIKFWKQSEYKVDISAGPQHDMWRGLAAALGEVMNCEQYKTDFEILLKEKTWGDFLSRLQDDHNLTEESIEKIKVSTSLDSDHEDVVETDTGQGGEDDHDGSISASPSSSGAAGHSTAPGGRHQTTESEATNSGNITGRNDQHQEQPSEIPEIEVVEHDWGPEREGPGGLGGGHNTSQEEREAPTSDGKRGEAALLAWLQKEFGDENVTNMNDQRPNNPGYDMCVKKDGEKHYYECKSFISATPPRRVSVTKTQLTCAERAKDRYWLCIVYDLNTNPAKMLPPIANPAALDKKPTGYKIDLASRSRDTDQ